ncbi:hypothetical protein SKAU_G00064170 [Synaphobranchus kaupii]|uniref:Superoxide dismutase [Cu-Zn] n=1 Tax=Synaphobranchus kaupii TaxID=118154 RepID=A0A9Q1G6I1_SYNKA|nr:hypothetical protein SKAU_G00064170 [Synaphobranchus kaupii]
MRPLALPLLLVLIGLHGSCCERYSHSAGAESRSAAPPEADQFNGTLYGACRMRPSTKLPEGEPKVYGRVLFRQDGPVAPLQVLFRLHGLPADSGQVRAVHVHQYGDMSDGCDSTGGHYNPHGEAHPGHPGDFGNFAPRRGRIRERREAEGATFFGGLSVLGRAVVIHEKEDDLGRGGDAGSKLHGNAGRRLACCVIGISSPKLWDKTIPHQRKTSG